MAITTRFYCQSYLITVILLRYEETMLLVVLDPARRRCQLRHFIFIVVFRNSSKRVSYSDNSIFFYAQYIV